MKILDLRKFILDELNKELPGVSKQEENEKNKESQDLIDTIAVMLKNHYNLPLVALFIIPDDDSCPSEIEEYLRKKFNFFKNSW